jgi:hypothetical protein
MIKKLTSVQYIEEYLKYKGIIIDDKTIPQVLVGVINEAKEMEKQQIIDAYIKGNYKSNREMYWKKESANKYYNEEYEN